MALRRGLVLAGLALAFLMWTSEAAARGGGRVGRGGGGFSRGGGSHMGSINRGGGGRQMGSMRREPNRGGWEGERRVERRDRVGATPDRTPRDRSRDIERSDRSYNNKSYRGDRNDRDDRRERGDRDDQRERVDDVKEARQDRRDEVREYHEYWHHNDIYVGMIVPTSMFTTYSCTKTTVVSSGVTYTECGDYWYRRRYSGGSVTYVVVDAPPGY